MKNVKMRFNAKIYDANENQFQLFHENISEIYSISLNGVGANVVNNQLPYEATLANNKITIPKLILEQYANKEGGLL